MSKLRMVLASIAASLSILLAILLFLPWQELCATGFDDDICVSRIGVKGWGALVLLAAVTSAAGLLLNEFWTPASSRTVVPIALLGVEATLLVSVVLKVTSDSSFRTAAPWIGLGLAVAIIGLAIGVVVMSLVSADRRVGSHRDPSASPPSNALAPPGWYPDPTTPVELRWWDGAAWRMSATEYRAEAGLREPPDGPEPRGPA